MVTAGNTSGWLRRLAVRVGWVTLLPLAAPAQSILYVGSIGGSGTLSTVDATTGAVLNPALIPATGGGFQFAADGSGSLYFTDYYAGKVGKYDAATGAVVNTSFITGLSSPYGIAIDASGHLYVANSGNGTVSVFDAVTGALINPTLITGLVQPFGLTLGGGALFVVNNGSGTVGKYNPLTGVALNAAFVSGLSTPYWATTDPSGSLLYVSSPNGVVGQPGQSVVGLYNAVTGAAIDSTLVTTMTGPLGLAADGAGHLYVASYVSGIVGEYDAFSGLPINANFVTGLNGPYSLLLAGVPEPPLYLLLPAGGLLLALARVRRLRCGRRSGPDSGSA